MMETGRRRGFDLGEFCVCDHVHLLAQKLLLAGRVSDRRYCSGLFVDGADILPD